MFGLSMNSLFSTDRKGGGVDGETLTVDESFLDSLLYSAFGGQGRGLACTKTPFTEMTNRPDE